MIFCHTDWALPKFEVLTDSSTSSNDKLYPVNIFLLLPAMRWVIFIESFLRIFFQGKSLQNRFQAVDNELRSLSAVDVQGHQRGGFCMSAMSNDWLKHTTNHLHPSSPSRDLIRV